MCGNPGAGYNAAAAQSALKPEQIISQIISDEAGVWVNPQVLRLIIKYRWDEVSKAAHQIHGSAS